MLPYLIWIDMWCLGFLVGTGVAEAFSSRYTREMKALIDVQRQKLIEVCDKAGLPRPEIGGQQENDQ